METRSYYCQVCDRVFSISSNSDRPEIPCPSCGGTAVDLSKTPQRAITAKGEAGKVAIIVNGVVRKAGTFACKECGRKYTFDTSFGNRPACPQCRSEKSIPTSPSALVFAGSRVATRREMKRTSYLVDTWKELKKFKEYRESLGIFLRSLELSEGTKKNLLERIDAAIAEAEEIRSRRVKSYDRVKI